MNDQHDHGQHYPIDPLTSIVVKRNMAAGAVLVLAILGMVMILNTDEKVGPIAVFTYGVACCLSAVTMVVAWGALDGHHTMTVAEQRTAARVAELVELAAASDARLGGLAERMTSLEEAVAWNTKMLGQMVHATEDEVSARRRNSHDYHHDEPTPPGGTRIHH